MSIIIKPREQVVIENHSYNVKETDIRKNIACVKRQLFFKNNRFDDILKKLERPYNIKVAFI